MSSKRGAVREVRSFGECWITASIFFLYLGVGGGAFSLYLDHACSPLPEQVKAVCQQHLPSGVPWVLHVVVDCSCM